MLGCAAMIAGATSIAAPYIPASDSVVLQRVPVAAEMRRFQTLRRDLAADANNVSAALQLSRAYLDVGQATSDPRFISYSQATLAPWLLRADAPADVLVLAAIAMQSSHRFDESLELLERAVHRAPRHSQAWLTKATVLQVRGEFKAARHACARLVGITDSLVALTCIASIDAMSGKLFESYATLSRAAIDDSPRPHETLSWIHGQLGEMAVRLGQDDAARKHFETALASNADDAYVKGEYADLLLRQRRTSEVISLLAKHEDQNALLLRLAHAEAIARSSNRRWRDKYASHDVAARRDADDSHLRERARYALDVVGDVPAALRLARSNWQVQREPADIRLFARAAHASRDAEALAQISAWIENNNYQDATLSALKTTLRRASK